MYTIKTAHAVPAALPKFVTKLVNPRYSRGIARPIHTSSNVNKQVLCCLPFSHGINISLMKL
jgi:hypothetical protein